MLNTVASEQSAGRVPLIGIQYLRAIAAIFIVYYHSIGQIPNYVQPFLRYFLGGTHLTNGVDVFFVISGFIMLVASRRSTPGDFLMRRIIRIIPLYWALTLLIAGLVALKPALFRSTVLNTQYLVKSILFIPYPSYQSRGFFFPLLVPGWSLNYEMFFYVVFSLSLFAPVGRRVTIIGSSFLIFYVFGVYFLNRLGPQAQESSVISFYASLHLFEFWSGMLIADFHLRGLLKWPPYIGWLLLAVSFVMLLTGLPIDLESRPALQFFIENLMPSATLLLAVVSLENSSCFPQWPRLAFLGDASYSLYLTHIFSLGLARIVWIKLGLQHESILLAGAFGVWAMALSVVLASLTYRFLETPTQKLLLSTYRRHLGRRAAGSLLVSAPPG